MTQYKLEQSEREILKNLCAEYGIEIVSGKGGKKHLTKIKIIGKIEYDKKVNECAQKRALVLRSKLCLKIR